MATTALIVEFLVAGVLLLFAIALFLFAVVGGHERSVLFASLVTYRPLLTSGLAMAVLTAVAYAAGVVAEQLGYFATEWRMDRVKRERLARFLRANPSVVTKSKLFTELRRLMKAPDGAGPVSEGTPRRSDQSAIQRHVSEHAGRYIGEMRFFVLMNSEPLYEEIAGQIRRLRLIRVLMLVELIVLASMIILVVQSFSPITLLVILFLIIGTVGTAFGIDERFHRYCRAVERAFLILMQAPPAAPAGQEPQGNRRTHQPRTEAR